MQKAVRRHEAVTAIEEAVLAARLDIVFAGQPLALSVSLMLGAIAVIVLASAVAAPRLVLWLATLALVCAIRFVLYRRYRHERARNLAALGVWERRFHFGTFVAGCAWGSSALLIFPESFALQGFLAFLLAGVSSGAMAELAVAPRIALAFILPCVAPLALMFFVGGDGVHTAMGVMCVLYVGLITFAMRRGHAQLKQTVAAQLDASASRRALTETAQRVEVMKSEFVSVVSHELRTPLTAIRGALGLLRHSGNGELAPAMRELLDVASRNADRLHLLIEDLLDIERIESGNLRLDLRCRRLLPLMERTLAANYAYATTHAVNLVLAPDAPDTSVIVDAERLLQVMSNLLSNAIKFSRARAEVRVTVKVAGERVRIEIQDSGCGIAPALKPAIFGKFRQGDSSDSRSKGGSGLGLAICKGLIEQMAGSIGYESEVGVGSTFFFELPVCARPVDA